MLLDVVQSQKIKLPARKLKENQPTAPKPVAKKVQSKAVTPAPKEAPKKASARQKRGIADITVRL
jgi:hypothetical protein